MSRLRPLLAGALALSVLAGSAGIVLAADENFARDFWTRQERILP